ncbi:MAG TPA: carboxypeptidase-like regulatory domain-containing protein [Candidatus Angelobacter sp.]|nr:carboxypeptidase-like regulatory domain-containing protein [Candidatus Angelobacter sp.]
MPRVLVQVMGRAMLTGSEGEFSFSFDDLPTGMTSVVQLTKPGYFAPGAKARFPSPGSTSVALGPDTGKVVLKLAPEAVITGRVTGPDDEPLEGASVQVLAYMSVNDDGPPRLLPVRGARSDEDGNFRIAGLSAGRYYVTVRSASINRNLLGAQTAETNQAYPPLVYYPGTQELSAAALVDLAPGQRLEVPFSLSLLPAYKVSGTVIAVGEWKRVNPPMILDGAGQTLFAANTFDSKTGAFEFRVMPAGNYSVRLSGTDPQDRSRFFDHKIAISKPVSGLKLVLKPGLDIPVVIRADFTNPRQEMHGHCTSSLPSGGVQQSDCSDYPKAQVELIAADATGLRFTTDYGPLKDSQVFGIHEVAPGKYLVRARATFGGYVQSVRSGSVDLLQESLAVAEGGTVMPIEVVLRDDSATLKVAVRTEKPGGSGAIVLYADGAPLLPPTRWGTASVGSYSYLGGLAPGSYKVFAFDSLDGIDFARPDSLAKYASHAASVTLSPNHESSVIVDVIHTGD